MPETAHSLFLQSTAHHLSLRESETRGEGTSSQPPARIADRRLPIAVIGGEVKPARSSLDTDATPTSAAKRHRNLNEHAIEAAVDEVVNRAPKLTAAQAARLATVLGTQ
ncbi:MAG: hypothetical protein ACTJGT_03920 [Microbacteriaceae bacterium]